MVEWATLLDDETKFITIIVFAFFVAFAFRIMLHYIDKSRIMSVAQEKGWHNVTVSWSPFAPGWLFEKKERHYKVRYKDDNGTNYMKYCKTSMFTGVYWREETI